MALHDALGSGQSVSVTATAGSSTLAVTGSGAYLFDTSSVGSGPNAATFSASRDGVKDTVALSAAAQKSLSNDQIALDLLNATRPAALNGKTFGADTPAPASTAQAEVIQATVQTIVAQAPAQTGYISNAAGMAILAVQTGVGQAPTGDNSDAVETAQLAQVAQYQSSPAAVANFQSLLAQGEQASPADRFYAEYADSNSQTSQIDRQEFQGLTVNMSDTQKASFTTAFNNRTLTISGEADLGGTGSSTDTFTVQGEESSGTGSFSEKNYTPNSFLIEDGVFGWTAVSWSDPSNVGS